MTLIIINPLHSRVAHRGFDLKTVIPGTVKIRGWGWGGVNTPLVPVLDSSLWYTRGMKISERGSFDGMSYSQLSLKQTPSYPSYRSFRLLRS